MKTLYASSDIFIASQVHLGVLDEFMAIVQTRLTETENSFARASLNDLLESLAEQRDSYQLAFAKPETVAA